MRIRKTIRVCASRYFNSWWIPFTISALSLASFIVFAIPALLGTIDPIGTTEPINNWMLRLAVTVGFMLVSAIGFVGVILWSLLRRRWLKLLSDIAMAGLFLFGVYYFVSITFLYILMCCQD